MKTLKELPSFEERIKALREAKERGDKPIEVNCISSKKWKILNQKTTVSTVYPARPEDFKEYRAILVYNEKLKTWQVYGLVEYLNVCPVCLKLMLVRAIVGSTWLACCSKKCYKKYFKVQKKRFLR